MTDFPYHMEALRKQRIIDRKHEALENLARKMEAQENERRLETRGGNLESRMGTRAAASRQATQQAPSKTNRYRSLLPPKPEPLHQWRDLQNNHLHHEARSLNKPYSTERKDGKGKEYWQRS